MMMRITAVSSLILGMTSLVACGPSPADMADVKAGQKAILARIGDLEKALQQVKASPSARPSSPDPNKIYSIPIDRAPVRGPRDAKVTIVTFSDFECPFSAMANGMIAQVLKDYPTDINFVYKQFPLTTAHPGAMLAAKAAVAAGKQGKFWEMHDLLFDLVQHSAELPGPDRIKEFAKENAGKMGLDTAQWEKDLNSTEVEEDVNVDVTEGRAADVIGTPTIFISGRRLQKGSVEGFKEMIEEALKRKDGKG